MDHNGPHSCPTPKTDVADAVKDDDSLRSTAPDGRLDVLNATSGTRPGGEDAESTTAGDPTGTPPVAQRVKRRAVAAWASWDWGSAAFNAVIVSFVYSVYLVEGPGANLSGSLSAETWLSIGTAIGGLIIAVTAPVTGHRVDSGGTRRRSLVAWTLATVVVMLGMGVITTQPQHFAYGVAFLVLGSITFQFAEVAYSSMIRAVSTPATLGRVSGIGWGAGYVGGVFLLVVAYVGFIAGDGDTRGVLGLSTGDGFNIRMVAVASAIWFAVFAVPVFFLKDTPAARLRRQKQSLAHSYRALWAELRRLLQTDRNTIWFLVASAIFRDGVAGVFAFGAILAVSVYGLAEDQVLVFGIAANVVSATGAFLAGWLDDWLGPKIVIVGSLVGMIVTMGVLYAGSGTVLFWSFGLVLTFFVGPVQSAARTFLTRVTPVGEEGTMFGLYTTTGRAVSFLAPSMFALFTGITGDTKAGILGMALVLIAGLVLTVGIPAPRDCATTGPPTAG